MTTDQLIIAGVSVLACILVAGLAWLALRLTRRSPIGFQVIIAVLAPSIAVAVAVAVNVRLMFISTHDSGVMILALSVALVVSVALALLVTRRIVAGTSRLGAGLSRLTHEPTTESAGHSPTDQPLPAELAQLVAELESTRTRLAEAREREQVALRARQQLVQHLSHDLRTPLAGLRAMAEALEDDMVADVPLAMRQIRSTVGRMDSLVGDLFELSRVQGGPPERERTLLSVSELIVDLVEQAESTARHEGVRLVVEVPHDDRLAITGDADDLGRALGNLIANAIRHTASHDGPDSSSDPTATVSGARVSGALVEVRAWRAEDGGVAVTVADACGGIPEPDLPRVFDAGWRGDLARSQPDGAGLGLAIARGVVESHQGRIAVHNETGGCRFDVQLPATAAVSG